jgi:hypothetical protein
MVHVRIVFVSCSYRVPCVFFAAMALNLSDAGPKATDTYYTGIQRPNTQVTRGLIHR